MELDYSFGAKISRRLLSSFLRHAQRRSPDNPIIARAMPLDECQARYVPQQLATMFHLKNRWL
ncbi:hypothetical protein I6F30_00980 [Bradyrhizobium sp. NBAIM20]|uniref:hypothetical protein n=1 Tax=unclassified Bradyrhizobium TaxID=2631580 RepID=UPI001CD578EF|nr:MULTISPECIES: hypothetical protein [unclassified Bradyrhizobium]MCA1409738.1 hypothetical protein [Bradyrhizobium sp. NBAIM20]MCA1459369.1 hypothetical protein [Bradyrhizobium sp. NBAIM18]